PYPSSCQVSSTRFFAHSPRAPRALHSFPTRRSSDLARLHTATFRQPEQGRLALDRALAEGRLAGLQSSVFWLPYFPPEMRFHFNAHNLLAYGRDGDDYLLSDPVFEEPVRCASADLQKARFAKGALAAKGLMYWLEDVPPEQDWDRLVRQSLVSTTRILDG